LDRDGVLIENVSTYVRTWEEVAPFEYSTTCLRRLKDAGFLLFVVTNQAIVGKGLMPLETIESLHAQIMSKVDPEGLVSKSYLCPHAPHEECDCRKPLPGSLLRAAAEFGVDLSASFMVGDAISDAEAGLAAGTKAIMVRTGRGRGQEAELLDHDLTVVDDLPSAVDLILAYDLTLGSL
jgi:D-glycero-D-manno-heptose 1,7-bisphosphate phosphatase